jgi:hypothetical protein
LSLHAFTSNSRILGSSCVEGDRIPWTSPELLNPTKFGVTENIFTKQSDCYALGMVIYEVLSGQQPYAPSEGPGLLQKVLDGERPERPHGSQGVGFTDSIWQTLERCWDPDPDCRPRLNIVLRCLQEFTKQSRSSYGEIHTETDTYDRSDDTSTSDSGMCCSAHLRSPVHLVAPVPSTTHSIMQNPPWFTLQPHLPNLATKGLTITNGDDGLRVSPLRSPPNPITSSMIQQRYGDKNREPPPKVNPKGRIGDRLLRRGRKIFRIVIGQLCGL